MSPVVRMGVGSCKPDCTPGCWRDRDIYGDLGGDVPDLPVPAGPESNLEEGLSYDSIRIERSGQSSRLLRGLQPATGDVMRVDPSEEIHRESNNSAPATTMKNVNVNGLSSGKVCVILEATDDVPSIDVKSDDGDISPPLVHLGPKPVLIEIGDLEGAEAVIPSERSVRPLPSNGSTGTVGSRASKMTLPNVKFKRAVKRLLRLNQGVSKVAMENKIGVQLTGWFRDVAFALQKGIADDGRRRCSFSSHEGEVPAAPSNGFHAPEPELFSRARSACGFTAPRYYATMGLLPNQIEPTLALVGSSSAAGKSGAFFFLSPDQQLIAKSCTKEDWNALLHFLPEYVGFVEAARERASAQAEKNGNRSRILDEHSGGQAQGFIQTLLPRYLGLYAMTLGSDPKPVRVLVMANVFGGALAIEKRYDLKGSTHGRKANRKEREKSSPVYKDLDWVAVEPSLKIGVPLRSMLLDTLKSDLEFLARNNLMDYSLLVGVHDIRDQAQSDVYEAMNVVTISDKTRCCYVGIIDVLTPYVSRKRAETLFLGQLLCGRDISCQKPEFYARRLLRFIETKVLSA